MFKRYFSSSATVFGKPGCSIVKPVHHLVKIDKGKLSPRFPGLKYSKNDIRSPSFKPTSTHQDRVQEYYDYNLKSDLLLINTVHNESKKVGLKRREWDGTSPFHLNRSLRKPRGSAAETPDIKVHTDKNIAKIKELHINCYVNQAKDNVNLAISSLVMLQQITGVKPKPIYSKTNVIQWKVRAGYQMGASVVLKGRPLHQFLTTLTEIVMPRIREYKGIKNSSGDKTGNIQLGLTPADVRFFPEIEANQDLWPKVFGMHMNIVTTAQTDYEARTLLSSLGLPFTGSERNVTRENTEY